MENYPLLKYQYHMLTWGGFYNNKYAKKHKQPSGDFVFDSPYERQTYIDKLRKIEIELGAFTLVINLTEGYCCNIRTVAHRVVKWDGKEYYSERDLGVNYPFSAAEYYMQNKWYPGFNDYPLGEEFDYETNKVLIMREWITGAHQIETETPFT